jgi:hypothetical protein
MNPLLALTAVTLLALGVTACGGAGKTTSQASSGATSAATREHATVTAPASEPPENFTKADADKDGDITAIPAGDNDNAREFNYGHAASSSEQRAITTLLKRYYAAAAAGDGGRACTMIYSTIVESVAEDYGQQPGPAYLRGGKTCPAVMTLLFKHFKSRLTADLPRLKVIRVRLVQHHGLAILGFGSFPERQIPVGREGSSWKVQALLDSELS